MPKKRPPNAEKGQFSGARAVECGRKGGLSTGKKNKENKTLQKIAEDFLNSSCKDFSKLKALACKMGLTEDCTIKALYVVVCLLNTMKKGKISDIEKLAELLGENIENSSLFDLEDDPLSAALKEEAERMNRENADK